MDTTETTTTDTPLDKALPVVDPLSPNIIKAPVISDADKEAFFKAFLAEQPFKETIKLFKGQFKVTFKTLSVAENNDIIRQISLDQKAGIAGNNDSYFIDIVNFRLAASLIDINGIPFLPEITAESNPITLKNGNFYVREKTKVLDSWPTFKLVGITESFRTFEAKIQELTKEIQNESFWKAAV